jgi:outer membrane biosynthesis protein TonB
VTVSELIVIDVAIFAFLIMIAAVIVVSRGRRSNRRFSTPPEGAAEPAGAGADLYARPITPGLRADTEEPDPAAYEPAEPEQPEPERAELEHAEPEQAKLEQVEPERAELEQAEPEHAELEQADPEQAEPERAELEQAEPKQAEPEQAAPPQVGEVAAPEPGRNGSAPEPDGSAPEQDRRQDGAGADADGAQIDSYYEGADRAIADYLASRGWPQEPGTHDPARHA